MPTALAISPHLDDAVFSAGGSLAMLARRGWRVIIATVFTASMPDPHGFALACQLDKGLPAEVDYMALRRDEDAAACAILGAEPRWLPFAEAPHRGYHSAEQLFASLHAGDAIVDTLTPALADLIHELAPDVVFSPQAIGNHVDHVAVFSALRLLQVRHWLWADYPYVVRSSSEQHVVIKNPPHTRERHVTLPEEDIDAKVRAALAYETQLGFQFGGCEAARRALARSGKIERYVANGELLISVQNS